LSYPELKGFCLSGKLPVKGAIAALPPRYRIHTPRVVFPLCGKVLGKPRNVYLVQKGTRNGIGHEGFLGYCPATSAGAFGEGRWDAIWGIVGMLAGAALYAEAYPGLQKTVLTWGDLGKITIPQVIGVNHWIIIPLFIIGGLLLFRWFEKNQL